MLKPFILASASPSLSDLCSVSKAGGLDSSCTTCGLASPQGGPYASGQGIATGCESPCAPKKHCFSFHLPKIHCNLPKLQHTTSYEWVLKKKHSFSLVHAPKETCALGSCGPARFMRRVRGRCSVRPGRIPRLRGSSGLRCWPACFPACQAGDLNRLGHRDDPGGPWR